MFQPLGTELDLHAPTGRLQLFAKKRLVLNSGLAKLLGFSRDRFEPGNMYIADEPHRLTVHREICEYLAEMNSSDNLHKGHPSTLIRSVHVENERCWSGQTETFSVLTFSVLQCKRLAQDANPQLTITVRDVNVVTLSFDYLCATLHIKKWLMLVVPGLSEYSLGWLWLTLVTLIKPRPSLPSYHLKSDQI